MAHVGPAAVGARALDGPRAVDVLNGRFPSAELVDVPGRWYAVACCSRGDPGAKSEPGGKAREEQNQAED
jgi:hypothetical protein